MRMSRVWQRWAEGKTVLCTTSHLTDPSVCEMISLLGFDCIWIDLEHHPTSVERAGQMMRGARVGSADVMVRPAKGEFMRMGRILEAGAQGIMYPRCEGAEEAREVVRWAKFAPQGERGFYGANPHNPFCMMDTAEYVRQANEQTFIVVQIESPAAVQQTRAIADVDGIDVAFFGPGDFSILNGVPGQITHKSVLNAAETICCEALAAGKRFGTPCRDVEHARQLMDMGATFLTHGSDIMLIKRGLQNIQQQFGSLGFSG